MAESDDETLRTRISDLEVERAMLQHDLDKAKRDVEAYRAECEHLRALKHIDSEDYEYQSECVDALLRALVLVMRDRD
jgi:outer membrane murein-binding lipoprotein Lpp